MQTTKPVAALFGVAFVGAACGGGPQIQTTTNYRPEAFRGAKVLVIPLAVSDDLGDERTGIVLSKSARTLASEAACSELLDASSDARIVCFSESRVARVPALAELELLFALDKPIPASVWQALREASGANHALLFRPEDVASSRETTTKLKGSTGALIGTGPLLATSAVVSAFVAANTLREEAEHSTELSYIVSASLVDMQTGKLLKVGVHSDSESRTETRNLGYAEAPPAAPLLEKIMVELGAEVLDE
jgi:hypothetical protein